MYHALATWCEQNVHVNNMYISFWLLWMKCFNWDRHCHTINTYPLLNLYPSASMWPWKRECRIFGLAFNGLPLLLFCQSKSPAWACANMFVCTYACVCDCDKMERTGSRPNERMRSLNVYSFAVKRCVCVETFICTIKTNMFAPVL